MSNVLSQEELFKKIEAPLVSMKKEWGCFCSSDNFIAVIEKANSLIKIVDYLNARCNLEEVPSNSGWILKTHCPFHKHGNERTPSFFINPELNRFYCQACSATGGIVEFICKKYKRPDIAVAEFIINLVNGKITIQYDDLKKINDEKKFNEFLIKLSELYNAFIKKNKYDDEAIKYIMKCMQGFDGVLDKNKKAVQEASDKVYDQIKLQLDNYGIKKGEK